MEATKASISPSMLAHYRDDLIEVVDRLAMFHEIPRLSSIFAELIYFLNHPDLCTKEFSKETLLDHATEYFNLLGILSDVYEKLDNYKTNTNREDISFSRSK